MPTQLSIPLMSCATAIRPAEIERKPWQRSRFEAKVRSGSYLPSILEPRRRVD